MPIGRRCGTAIAVISVIVTFSVGIDVSAERYPGVSSLSNYPISRAKNWNSLDLALLAEPSNSFILALIDASLFPQLYQDPASIAIRNAFPDYRWKQWKNWGNLAATGEGDTVSLAFTAQGRLREYRIRQLHRSHFEYTANGDLLTWTQYTFDPIHGWREERQYAMSYGPGHMLETMTLSIWSAQKKEWVAYLRNSISYSKKTISQCLYQSWNSQSMTWENNHRYVYTADGKELITESVFMQWDKSAGIWKSGSSKAVYGYDGKGLLTTMQSYVGTQEPGGWLGQEQVLYGWENKEACDSIVYQSWDKQAALWKNTLKIETSPALNGLSTEVVQSLFDTVSQEWQADLKTIESAAGGTDGNIVEKVILRWSRSGNDWEYVDKFGYLYDAGNEKPVAATVYAYDKAGSRWVLKSSLAVAAAPESPIVNYTAMAIEGWKPVVRANGRGFVMTIPRSAAGERVVVWDASGRTLAESQGVIGGTETRFTWNAAVCHTQKIYFVTLYNGDSPVTTLQFSGIGSR